jgi:hypothetical protein
LVTAARIVTAADEPRQRLVRGLPAAVADASRGRGWLRRTFAAPATKDRDQQALGVLAALVDGPDAATVDAAFADLRAVRDEARRAPEALVWRDLSQAAAVYQTLLAVVRGEAATAAAETGHVPQAVADAAEQVDLDVTLLTVRLRAYQVFGARYVLSRSGAIRGDEMGLGKTIEAIAVMAHLARHGPLTALVVAPASVASTSCADTSLDMADCYRVGCWSGKDFSEPPVGSGLIWTRSSARRREGSAAESKETDIADSPRIPVLGWRLLGDQLSARAASS